MACCLMAPSHCLNQWWLHISKDLWHSPQSNFTGSAQAAILYNYKIILLKLLPYLPQDNELILDGLYTQSISYLVQLTALSSMKALKAVILTAFNAFIDDKVVTWTTSQCHYPGIFPGHQCIQRHLNNPSIMGSIPCLSWQFPFLSLQFRSCHDDRAWHPGGHYKNYSLSAGIDIWHIGLLAHQAWGSKN